MPARKSVKTTKLNGENMKKLLATLSVATLAGMALVAPALAQPLKVGISAEPYPPFTMPDAAGNWTGWEVDFAKAVCEEAKLDCVITPLSWDGIIPALNAGKIDMIITSMSITNDRLKAIDFSDAYYKSKSAVIGLKELTFDATPEGLADKTLGAQVGTRHLFYAQKHFVPGGTTLREYQTQDEANNDLVSGRIDAIEADEIAMREFLETDAGKACCDMKGVVSDDEDVLADGAGIGLRKTDTELKDKLNVAIHAIRENGKYAEFSKKYFEFDIYGE